MPFEKVDILRDGRDYLLPTMCIILKVEANKHNVELQRADVFLSHVPRITQPKNVVPKSKLCSVSRV